MKKQIPFLIALITILFLAGIVVVLIISMQETKEDPVLNGEVIIKEKDEPNLYEAPLSRLSKLIMGSDLVCYAEIIEVDKEYVEIIREDNNFLMPGEVIYYPNQNVKARCLKVLMGSEEYQGKEINILKRTPDYHLRKNEKTVLYLLEESENYVTTRLYIEDERHPNSLAYEEGRLPHVLSEVNILRKDKPSGAVVSVLGKDSYKGLRVYIIEGRQKAPISVGTSHSSGVVDIVEIGEFNVVEVPLEYGSYTILLEFEEKLYSFNRLVNGYYPYLLLNEERDERWVPIYFDLEEILK